MAKKTKLGEDASIYQPKREISEKENFKNMSLKNKFSHLWEYYKIHGFIIIGVIAFIIYIVYQIRTPNVDVKLYAAIINNTIETEVWDDYEEKLLEYLEFDPETSEIFFNDIFYYNSTPDYEANVRQAFAIYITAAEVDLIIAPMSEFSNYVHFGFLDPLSDQLPTDLYSTLTDDFYLSGTEDNPKVNAYGIYLSDTKLFKEYSRPVDDGDPYIIGIVANSQHKESAVKFIRYIYIEDKKQD